MTIKDLIEKFKLKGKKTAAIVGMSAALSATAVGCGDKEVVVEPTTTTESVDETAVIEEEITTEVEETVVTPTPTPAVEELVIETIYQDEVNALIEANIAKYPEVDPEMIKFQVAGANGQFMPEEDLCAVLGISSYDELIGLEDKFAAAYNFIGMSFCRTYFLGIGVDLAESNKMYEGYPLYENCIKLEDLFVDEKMVELSKSIDADIATLVASSVVKQPKEDDAAYNLGSYLTGIKTGLESNPYKYDTNSLSKKNNFINSTIAYCIYFSSAYEKLDDYGLTESSTFDLTENVDYSEDAKSETGMTR